MSISLLYLILTQENIPADSTHDSLRASFEKIGPVSYVSVPRHPNKEIKGTECLLDTFSIFVVGFAFIEYEKQEDAKRACAELNAFNEETNLTGLRVISK